MGTTQRLGIDIVGTDRTKAAFMSAQRSLGAFSKTVAFATGALAGLAGGNLLKNVVQSFIQINKHVEPVKRSFTLVDRAWQQFALNVGKAGLNSSLINFNERMATMIVRLKSLSDIIGDFLGGGIDNLTNAFTTAGRAIAFVSDNLTEVNEQFKTLMGFDFKAPVFFEKPIFDLKGFGIDTMRSMGIQVNALTEDFSKNQVALSKLPPTFDELKKSGSDAESAFEKLTMIKQRMFESTRTPMEKYISGIRELTVVQSSLGMSADLVARQQAKLREEFLGTGKTVKDEFNAMQEAGNAFGDSFKSALEGIAGGTFKLKDALGSLLSDLTSVFSNRAVSLLGGAGAGGGFFGKLLGSSFGGLYASGGTLGAGKWGIAGENGPEPIVGPATVIPNRGSGAVNVKVNIINQAGVDVQQRQSPDGRGLDVLITNKVNDVIGSGRANKAMRGQYGMQPQRARR